MAIQSGLSSFAVVECHGMLFNRSEVNEVQQGSRGRENGVVEFASFSVYQPGGLDERRRALQILLKKHRRINAARPTLQDRRPIFQIRHQVRADAQVITKQIKLGDLLVRPIDAFETGNRNRLAFDVDQQIAFGLFQTEETPQPKSRCLSWQACVLRSTVCE